MDYQSSLMIYSMALERFLSVSSLSQRLRTNLNTFSFTMLGEGPAELLSPTLAQRKTETLGNPLQ